MRTETAQRFLGYAMLFIILDIILIIAIGIGLLAIVYTDFWPFYIDPSLLAFMEAYPLAIPIVICAVAGFEIIYLVIVNVWRKDPIEHRIGLSIVGIVNLGVCCALPGLVIFMPAGFLVLLPPIFLED